MIITDTIAPANRLAVCPPSHAGSYMPAAPEPEPAVAPAPVLEHDAALLAQWRPELVTRSPDEEWQARSSAWGWPEPLSDAVVAAFLMKTRQVTVRASGIELTEGREDLRFWQEDSILIQQSLEGALSLPAKLDPDDPSCIHLFRYVGEAAKQNLEYIETIARYVAPQFSDKEALAKVLAAKKRQINRLHAELAEDHAFDTQRAAAREISNADKLQRVRTFPITAPATTRRAAAATDATSVNSLLEPATSEAAAANSMGGVAATGMQPRSLSPEATTYPLPSASHRPADPSLHSDSQADDAVPALTAVDADSPSDPRPISQQIAAAKHAAQAYHHAAPKRAADARAARHRTQADLLD